MVFDSDSLPTDWVTSVKEKGEIVVVLPDLRDFLPQSLHS